MNISRSPSTKHVSCIGHPISSSIFRLWEQGEARISSTLDHICHGVGVDRPRLPWCSEDILPASQLNSKHLVFPDELLPIWMAYVRSILPIQLLWCSRTVMI